MKVFVLSLFLVITNSASALVLEEWSEGRSNQKIKLAETSTKEEIVEHSVLRYFELYNTIIFSDESSLVSKKLHIPKGSHLEFGARFCNEYAAGKNFIDIELGEVQTFAVNSSDRKIISFTLPNLDVERGEINDLMENPAFSTNTDSISLVEVKSVWCSLSSTQLSI